MNLQAPMPHEATADERQLGRADALAIALALLFMVVEWYKRGHDRMYWGDELIGWLVMREPTFSRMIHEWWAGLDSGSLFFMVFGRWWMQAISPSELSLRAFSAAGVGASFVVLWVTARRFYSVGVVAFGLPFLYLVHLVVTWQLSNGRMYGGLLAASAFVVYAFVKADPKRPLTHRLLWVTFGAHLFLLSSHILGPMYSGVFLAGLMAQDLYARQWRWKLYLSAVAAWPILLLTYKNTLGTMALGNPKYWTVKPTGLDFLRGLGVYDDRVLKVMGGMALIVIALRILRPRRESPTEPEESRSPVYFVLAVFCSTLVLAWCISRVTTSIFFDRYLLPVALGDALLMCELAHRIVRGTRDIPLLRYAMPALAVLLFAVGYLRKQVYYIPYPNYTAQLVARDHGLPMVICDYMMFAEMQFYQHDHAAILMWVDWPVVLAPDFGPGGAAGPREMDNWKSAGYFADKILPTADILSRYPDFLIVNDREHTSWFERYVAHNPRYIVTREPSFRGRDVWLAQSRQEHLAGSCGSC